MQDFKHQLEEFEFSKDLEFRGLLWEMRVGKTRPILRTAVHLSIQKKIDAVLVIAPNGVHLNWSRKEILNFLGNALIFEWQSSKAGGKKFKENFDEFLKCSDLLWFCFNVEGIATKKVEEYIEKILKQRKVLVVFDESHWLKNPGAERTKAAFWIAKASAYRRILTGTPATQGPFDLWSQFHLLSPTIFSENIRGQVVPMKFTSFKTRYGIFKNMKYGNGPWHLELNKEEGDGGYKDLDHLAKTIEPYCSRLTQKEVFENLPALVHDVRYFEMAPHHKKHYDKMKEDLLTQLEDGTEITAQQAIVCLLRLQQLSRGFVSQKVSKADFSGSETIVHPLFPPYPAVEALLDWLGQLEGKAIVWCHFTADVDLICETLIKEKIGFVRYDGKVEADLRSTYLQQFSINKQCKVIVGTPAAGGIGVDMSAADAMAFYSHGFNFSERLQAIARMQGPNQKSKSLLLTDFVAIDSIDEKCLSAHEAKQNLADILTGDALREILK